MLEEYLKLYKTQASKIDGWEKINKNTLCNMYIDNEGNEVMRESIFSAIVARYWGAMSRLFSKCSFGVSEEDCYQWLIESVCYALEHRAWLDPSSKLYGDKNGPDKVINRCLKSRRLTHYQLLNKDKRVANLNTISVEAAEDDLGDFAIESLGLTEDNDNIVNTFVKELIEGCAESGDVFISILLDMILNEDILQYDTNAEQDTFTLIDKRKMLKILSEEPDRYIKDFIDRNKLSENVRKLSEDMVRNMTYKRLNVLLPRALSALRTARMRKLLYK